MTKNRSALLYHISIQFDFVSMMSMKFGNNTFFLFVFILFAPTHSQFYSVVLWIDKWHRNSSPFFSLSLSPNSVIWKSVWTGFIIIGDLNHLLKALQLSNLYHQPISSTFDHFNKEKNMKMHKNNKFLYYCILYLLVLLHWTALYEITVIISYKNNRIKNWLFFVINIHNTRIHFDYKFIFLILTIYGGIKTPIKWYMQRQECKIWLYEYPIAFCSAKDKKSILWYCTITRNENSVNSIDYLQIYREFFFGGFLSNILK